MSARWRGTEQLDERPGGEPGVLLPMSTTQLDAVMAIEVSAYAFPWTRGNFIDSLAAGYAACALHAKTGPLLGYFIAMAGVDEMHLLNITVAPAVQGRGHARVLFDELLRRCRANAARELWLEVRESNVQARAVYTAWGFAHIGVRKGYYPAAHDRREDAVVMSLQIAPLEAKGDHALE